MNCPNCKNLLQPIGIFSLYCNKCNREYNSKGKRIKTVICRICKSEYETTNDYPVPGQLFGTCSPKCKKIHNSNIVSPPDWLNVKGLTGSMNKITKKVKKCKGK